LVFLPAGTLHYWQAWLFLAVFFVCSLAITVYLAKNHEGELQEVECGLAVDAVHDVPSQGGGP
jgi:hypothetical protein